MVSVLADLRKRCRGQRGMRAENEACSGASFHIQQKVHHLPYLLAGCMTVVPMPAKPKTSTLRSSLTIHKSECILAEKHMGFIAWDLMTPGHLLHDLYQHLVHQKSSGHVHILGTWCWTPVCCCTRTLFRDCVDRQQGFAAAFWCQLISSSTVSKQPTNSWRHECLTLC